MQQDKRTERNQRKRGARGEPEDRRVSAGTQSAGPWSQTRRTQQIRHRPALPARIPLGCALEQPEGLRDVISTSHLWQKHQHRSVRCCPWHALPPFGSVRSLHRNQGFLSTGTRMPAGTSAKHWHLLHWRGGGQQVYSKWTAADGLQETSLLGEKRAEGFVRNTQATRRQDDDHRLQHRENETGKKNEDGTGT